MGGPVNCSPSGGSPSEGRFFWSPVGDSSEKDVSKLNCSARASRRSREVWSRRSASTPRNCQRSFTESSGSLRSSSKKSSRLRIISSQALSQTTVAERGALRIIAISPT